VQLVSQEKYMRKSLYLLVFVLGISLAYATSQTSGSSQYPTPQTQTPTTSQPSSSPDQTQTPDTKSGSATQASAGGDVQTQIETAIKNDPTLSNDNITVTVSDKTIELNGTVASKKDKQAAKKIAEQYAGNRKVKDHLTVSSSGHASAPSASGSASTTPDNTAGSISGNAQAKTPPDTSSTGAASSTTGGVAGSASTTSTDTQTTGSTSTTGAAQTPPSTGSASTATGGVAGSATGTQSTPQGTSTTGAIGGNTSGTTGTTGVTNETTAAAGSDLQLQIQNALKNEPTLSNDTVNVVVSEEEIDLSGNVATGKEKQTARRIVQSYAGNRKVKDNLTVTGRGQGANTGSTPPDNNNTANPSSNTGTSNPATNPEPNKNNPPSGSKPPNK
jgi:trimeric autotransporter adhesin